MPQSALRLPLAVYLALAQTGHELVGFKVNQLDVDSSRPQGTVVFTAPSDSAMPGSVITIYVSNGRRGAGDNNGPTETTVQVPGVGPVVIQLPG